MLMSQEKAKKIHLIYGCIAALLIVALAIGFMLSFWDIYQSGDRPYTRASIGEKLQLLSILIYVTIGMIIGGALLNVVIPLDRPKTKAIRDELVIMQKIASKAGTPNAEEKAAIEKQHHNRWLCTVLTAGVFGGLVARPGFYLLDCANFPGTDPTSEITAAALMVLPVAVIGLCACYVCSLLVSKSILKETEIYKQIIASGNKVSPTPAPNTDKPVLLKTIRFIILAVALVFIVVGILNGSAEDVLTKAIKICTECIGLG